MASALEQLGLSQDDFTQKPSGSALDQLGLKKEDFTQKAPPKSDEDDGIQGPGDVIKNIGQGFNRGLGTMAGAADYALLGFLDDTPEGRSKRPLGYVSNVLRGHEDVPLTDGKRFAEEPSTRGEEIWQRGGEVLAESVPTAGALAAAGKWLAQQGIQPTKSMIEWALARLSQMQAGTVAPATSALSNLTGKAATAAAEKTLGKTVGGAVAKGTGAIKSGLGEGKQAVLLGGETAGSIGSGVGEELGKNLTPGSQIGPVLGSLGGGIAPSMSTLGTVPLARKVGNMAAEWLLPDGSKARARDYVAGHIGPHIEGDAVQERMARGEGLKQEIEGFNPDLAQVTGSEALKETKDDIFKKASGADLEELRGREKANQEALTAYAAKNAPEGEGDPDLVFQDLIAERELAAQKARDLEAQKAALPLEKRDQTFDARERAAQQTLALDERSRALPTERDIATMERDALDELTARVNGARADLAGSVRRVDRAAEGQNIREGIKAERQARNAEIREMSENLGISDLQLTTPFRAFARNVKKWADSLPPSKKKNLPDSLADIDHYLSKSTITFEDVKAFRESLVDDNLEAGRDLSPGHRKRQFNARQMRDRLDNEVLGLDQLEGFVPGPSQTVERASHYANASNVEDLLEAAKFKTGKAKPFETLSDFLTNRGGVRESGGELGARDIGARSRPGLFRRNGGMSQEDATLAAWEAGYFPGQTMRPDPDMLRSALEEDLTGTPRYKESDMDAAADLGQQADVAQDFTDALDDLGIDWQKASPDEIRARIDEMTEDPVDRSAAAENWREFRRAYFDKIIEPFERGTVKKTTSKDGTGFYRTIDEDIALDFLKSGDAAEQLSRIGQTQPAIMDAMEAVTLDDLASSAISNGVISPRALERWVEKRAPALRHMPRVLDAVDNIAREVGAIEGGFAGDRQSIRQDRMTARERLANERAQIAQERTDLTRGREREIRQIGQEAETQGRRLDEAMQPLLERMGVHNERKAAAEDTMLAKRLARIQAGGATPGAVIDEAMAKPELMTKLWQATASSPDARKALQRHLWDGLTTMDGASLRAYLTNHAKSLRIAFSPDHLKKLNTIADAMEMVEFARPTGKAKPIQGDMVTRLRELTGLNPSAMAGSYTGLSRGRSNKTVEMVNNLYRWMSERNRQGTEKLMRRALFDPDVAQSLIESAQMKSPKAGDTAADRFATRRLRGWMFRLGVAAPFETAKSSQGQQEEQAAPVDIGAGMTDPTVMSRVWASAGSNQATRREIRRQAWQGLEEPTGKAIRGYLDAHAPSLRAIFPPDHIKRAGMIADGMSLADGSMEGKVSRTTIGLGQFGKWLTEQNPEGADILMREALANPDLASALAGSLAVKIPGRGASTLDQFATPKLQRHMARLGVI
jgi:hypothetical protein